MSEDIGVVVLLFFAFAAGVVSSQLCGGHKHVIDTKVRRYLDMKKYELTGETMSHGGRVLYRIKALRDFGIVKAGDLGGWVESEKNLSHDGTAWVSGNALVTGNARVFGDARVCGNAGVYGNAQIYGSAMVYGNAIAYGNAGVCGDAMVYGNARVCGNAMVYGNAIVYSDARVYGNAQIYGNAIVYSDAWVFGTARVSGNAQVCGDARVYGTAQVSGDAWVSGNAWPVSPLYIQGTRHALTTSSRAELAIGCESYSVDYWLEHYVEIGEQHGYTPEQIEEYGRHIRYAAKWLEGVKT